MPFVSLYMSIEINLETLYSISLLQSSLLPCLAPTPRVTLQGNLPYLLPVIGIVEAIALYSFGFPRKNLFALILISTIANLFSTVCAIVLFYLSTSGFFFFPGAIYFPLNQYYLGYNFWALLPEFILSSLIEAPIFCCFKSKNLYNKLLGIKAVFLANLASYILLAILTILLSIHSPSEDAGHIDARSIIEFVLRTEVSFRIENTRFALDFEELEIDLDSIYTSEYKTSGSFLKKINSSIYGNDYYVVKFSDSTSANLERVLVTFTAKKDNLSSITGAVVLDKAQGKSGQTQRGSCITEKPAMVAPPPPTFKDNKIICSPGSEKIRG